MTRQITREQFEALRPAGEAKIATERDVEYSYEAFLNDDGEEIAFATYHSTLPATFTLRDGFEHLVG